jgi:hypothetical protein
MKTFYEAKKIYIAYHKSQDYKDQERRLNALNALEKEFKYKFPEALQDEDLFANIKKPYFSKLYQCLKGKALNGAEISVINGLYKFSK